jgi:two-component system chemotaxis response regulator CheY
VRALIIDDSRATRIILKKFLQSQGFDTLFEAGHGKEALERLKQTGPVDLALVDWNMPEMNGLEFVSTIRQTKAFDGMRLMMVTTESELEQVARALEAGANEYIMKPFTTEGLRDKLELLGFATRDA